MKLQICTKLSATYKSGKTLEVFLDLKKFIVIKNMVKAAISNKSNSKKLIALLFQKKKTTKSKL